MRAFLATFLTVTSCWAVVAAVDSRTVEILRKCAAGESNRFIRRIGAQPKELILDITEPHPDGRRFERHLVFEKQ
jgi:hypothetical protein